MKKNPNFKNNTFWVKDSLFLKNSEEAMNYPITFFVKHTDRDNEGIFIKYSSDKRKKLIQIIENGTIEKFNLLSDKPDKGSTALPREWLLKKLKYSPTEIVKIKNEDYCLVSEKELKKHVVDEKISDKELKKLIAKIDPSFPLFQTTDHNGQNLLHLAIRSVLERNGSPLKALTMLHYINVSKSDNNKQKPYDLIKDKSQSVFSEQSLWLELLQPPITRFFVYSHEEFIQKLLTDENFKVESPGFYFLNNTNDYYYVIEEVKPIKIQLSDTDKQILEKLITKFKKTPEELSNAEKRQLCNISTESFTNTLLIKYEKTLRNQYREKMGNDENNEDEREKNVTYLKKN